MQINNNQTKRLCIILAFLFILILIGYILYTYIQKPKETYMQMIKDKEDVDNEEDIEDVDDEEDQEENEVEENEVEENEVEENEVEENEVEEKNQSKQDVSIIFNQLDAYMTDDLRCPKLEEGGTVRVYVSGGMFDLADTLYSIGVDGLKPKLDYQSINLIDMICTLSDNQMSELKKLCVLWDVPWYGIVGEIEKMGWECYCPVRDGLTMATIIAAVSVCTMDDITKSYDAGDAGYVSWDNSIFNKKNHPKGVSEDNLISMFRSEMIAAIGTNIGANDLYNMYSTCNACIMNYNGIEPDAGALAEVGQLGARGVPCVIIKGSMQGDFSGISNPMPTMATSATNKLIPNLTRNPGSVYVTTLGNNAGALPYLKEKVDRFIANQDYDDPLTFGNYNNFMPLPPLQIFWTELGSKAYFLKHKYKSIQTLPNGKTNFKEDYTDFWYENVVKSDGTSGLVQVAKAMADNLNYLRQSPKYRNIYKYWS
jgi:hypothetical protein